MPTMGSKTDYPGYLSGRGGGGEMWDHNHLRFRYAYHGTKGQATQPRVYQGNGMRALFHLGMHTVGPRAWLPRPLYQGWGSRG